jgi:hypothetical protein
MIRTREFRRHRRRHRKHAISSHFPHLIQHVKFAAACTIPAAPARPTAVHRRRPGPVGFRAADPSAVAAAAAHCRLPSPGRGGRFCGRGGGVSYLGRAHCSCAQTMCNAGRSLTGRKRPDPSVDSPAALRCRPETYRRLRPCVAVVERRWRRPLAPGVAAAPLQAARRITSRYQRSEK